MRLTRNCKIDAANLTEEAKELVSMLPDYDYARNELGFATSNTQQCLDKLGQYEDVEEELGIDLIALLKDCHSPLDFMKKFCVSKAWIFTEYVGKNKKMEGQETLQKCDCFWYETGNRITFITKDGWRTDRKISDYGKTWALTKEELE